MNYKSFFKQAILLVGVVAVWSASGNEAEACAPPFAYGPPSIAITSQRLNPNMTMTIGFSWQFDCTPDTNAETRLGYHAASFVYTVDNSNNTVGGYYTGYQVGTPAGIDGNSEHGSGVFTTQVLSSGEHQIYLWTVASYLPGGGSGFVLFFRSQPIRINVLPFDQTAACGTADGGVFAEAPGVGLCERGTAVGPWGGMETGSFDWWCVNTDIASCRAHWGVNGQCGFQPTDVIRYTSEPIPGLCASGTLDQGFVNRSGNELTWRCLGEGAGEPAFCNTIDGESICGSASNGVFGRFGEAGFQQSNLCGTFFVDPVADPVLVNDRFVWQCHDVVHDVTLDCSAGLRAPSTYSVSVSRAGNGVGTVASVGTGAIDCGLVCSEAGITSGSNRVLRANPNNSTVSWSADPRNPNDCDRVVGNDCFLDSIANNRSVTVTFNQQPINNRCGSADGRSFSNLTSTSPNLCTTFGAVNFRSVGSGWMWDCYGQFGGSTEPDCKADYKQDFYYKEVAP